MRAIYASRGRILFLVSLVVAGYFVYTFADGAVRNHRLAEQRSEAAQELHALHDKKAYLEAVKRYVASDAYVEQEARRQLGFIRDGEVPIVVLSPELPGEKASGAEWWERLFPR